MGCSVFFGPIEALTEVGTSLTPKSSQRPRDARTVRELFDRFLAGITLRARYEKHTSYQLNLVKGGLNRQSDSVFPSLGLNESNGAGNLT